MKNRYIPPEIKVVTFAVRSNILESSYIGQGDGVIEARKNTFGFWDSEDDEYDEGSGDGSLIRQIRSKDRPLIPVNSF